MLKYDWVLQNNILYFEMFRGTSERRIFMIEVTRYDNTKVMINIDLVERVEECPETIITFVNGKQIIVRESKEEIKAKAIEVKRQIFHGVRWED